MSFLTPKMICLPQLCHDESIRAVRHKLLDQAGRDNQPKKEKDRPVTHLFMPLEETGLFLSISRQMYINSMRFWISWSRIKMYNFFWSTPPSVDKHKEIMWLFPGSQLQKIYEYPLSDTTFAEQRFCSHQTGSLEKLKEVPKWAPQTQDLIGKCEKRQLFLVNYEILKGCATKRNSHIPIVMGIFSCVESYKYNTECLSINGNTITPHTPGLWAYAKACFQVCDSIYFFIINRLCGSFLFLESIALYFSKNIPMTHPLYCLLKPLFYGMATSCHFAKNMILEWNGLITQLLPLSTEGVKKLVDFAFEKWSFEKTHFIHKTSQREILNTFGYAYCEDGKDLFHISHFFAIHVVNCIYKTDEDVSEDYELAKWLKETSDVNQGNVKDFPTEITTKKAMIGLVEHLHFLFFFDRHSIHEGIYDQMCFMPSFPMNVSELANHTLPHAPEEIFHLLGHEEKTLAQIHALYVFCNEMMKAPTWESNLMHPVLKQVMEKVDAFANSKKIALRDRLQYRMSPFRHYILKSKGFLVTSNDQ